ncbi:hypothetical protein [Streptomyces sp. G45]|uniref:hypothetical protein n=1 Tax=Streptomyces sp. G45 TaxID=3406627 RepID=UPI003C270E2D
MSADWLATLAAAGAGGLVSAATTDAWQTTRDRFVHLLGRGDPERARAAAGRLDALRAAATGTDGDRARAQARLAWRVRLQDLLEEHPEAAAELQAAVAAFAPPERGGATYRQYGRAEGHGRVIMNQHGDQSVRVERAEPDGA